MAAFTAWKFDGPDGADRAASILKDCEREGMVKILGHAVVSWPQGASQPTTKQGHEENWRGTRWGAFWGVLLGALFFVPVVGGVAGAISKMTQDAGITKEQRSCVANRARGSSPCGWPAVERVELQRCM